MLDERIVGHIVMGICAFIVILIGVFQMKSKNPVMFWSGVTPPSSEEITDVKAYNKKHGIMWILYGIGLMIAYGIGVLLKSGVVLGVAVSIEVFGGVIVMILYHNHLNTQYLKR